MTLRMSASLSSSWPTILTNGNAEERAAAAASEVAEAVQRRERAREEECGPAARGRTARGFPARDVMADMVRGRVRVNFVRQKQRAESFRVIFISILDFTQTTKLPSVL